MKKTLSTIIIILVSINVFAQNKAIIVTTDITNFWNAFDKIVTTKDSATQYSLMNTLYIDKASLGLKAMMQARNYTAKSYIDAINNYPLFWASVRSNTNKATEFAAKIEVEIAKLKILYPKLKPATMYFTIGALRSNGTTLEGMVLIGSELALADKAAITTELPESSSHLRGYFDQEPIKNVVFLNVHEYIHTQQKTTIGNNLIQQCVIEGVAEFLAVKAMGQESPNPQIKFGKENNELVQQTFIKEMFSPYLYNWLWNDANNELKMRDMGYYIGYIICENYYEKAKDKNKAIKEMIELDYTNAKKIEAFVNQSGYFKDAISVYEKAFEANRPTVLNIKQFSNGSKKVSSNIAQVTITFSEVMDKNTRSFEYGPLGEANVMSIKNVVGFSDDGKSFTFEVELKPNRKYQLIIGTRFVSVDGVPLKPYLIEFETGK